jgi:tetratricopeptide (TPR) repeat protein
MSPFGVAVKLLTLFLLLPPGVTLAQTLSFLPFQDLGNPALTRDQFLQGGLPAVIATNLAQLPTLSVVLPGEDKESGLWVMGWYQRTGQDGRLFELQLAALEAESSTFIWQSEASGNYDDLFSLLNGLSAELVLAVQRERRAELLVTVQPPPTKDLYAFVIFGRGINALLGIGRAPDLAAASGFFRKAVLIDPEFSFARFFLARQVAASGAKEQAAELLKTTLEKSPELLPAYRWLGELYTELQLYELARQAFEALLLKAPDDLDGRTKLAALLLSQQDLAAALSEFLEVSRRDPKNIAVYQKIADIYFQQDQSHLAAEALRAVLRLSPSDPEARDALGAYLRETGNAKEAESLYRDAVKRDPNDLAGWKTLGDVRKEGGDLDGAEAAYNETLQRNPLNAEARASLGGLFVETGRYQEAKTLLEAAASLGARRAEVLGHLGLARLYNDAVGAATALRDAHLLAPSDAVILYNLGLALFANKDCAEARTSFAQAALLKSDFAAAHYQLGLTSLSCADERGVQETFDFAKMAFERAIRLDPSIAEAHYNLAVLLEKNGNLNTAVREYEEYLLATPSAKDAETVRNKINELKP